MNRFLIRLLLVIVAVSIAAVTTGFILDHIYKKRWQDIFFRKTSTLVHENKRYDVIFLGDSRVHFGINPYYFDSVSGFKSYNFGYGASDAQEVFMTTNVYLKRHPRPRLAVLSMSPGCMTENIALRTRFQNLFFLEDDSIAHYMNSAGFRTGAINAVPFLKYSFFDEYNRTSLFVPGAPLPRFDHNIYEGFLNIHKNLNSDAIYLYNIDGLWLPAIAYFENTIKVLLQSKVQVVLVSAPERRNSVYRQSHFRKTVDSIFESTARKYAIPFLHFENDTTVFTEEYFVDDVHLNEPGTRIYSMKLADSLLKYR